MERIRRRWWTTLISGVAGLLVFTAVASGVFQIAVLMVPGYREQLADWVSEVAGRPVDIGGVHLLWRGLSPQIELSDIVLRDTVDEDDGSLRAERLRLGFSLRRMVRGDFMPDRVLLSGLQLRVEIDEAHRVRVAGFESRPLQPGAEPRNWRAAVARFSTLVLSDAQIRVRYPLWENRPLDLAIEEASLSQTDAGFDLVSEGSLPAGLGGAFAARAEVRGESDRIDQWSGRWQLRAQDLVPAGWVVPGWTSPLPLQAEQLQVDARGQFQSGRLQQVQLETEALSLRAVPEGPEVAQLTAKLEWQPAATGNLLSLSELRLAGEPKADLRLRWGKHSFELDAPYLDLTTLAPWLAVLDASALQRFAALRGALRNAHVRAGRAGDAAPWQYTVESDVEAGGWQGEDAVAVTGLSGRLVATDQGGRFSPADSPWSVRLPTADPAPLAFERFQGDLLWTRQADAPWLLRMPAFEWQIPGALGTGRGTLVLDPQAGPVLDLQMALSVADLTALKPLMPARWKPRLRDWLSRGIVAGDVPEAQLSINGPVRDFPFGSRPTGQWRLTLPLRNATIAYSPDWPPLTDVDADLVFAGNRLSVDGQKARLAGLAVTALRADIAAMHLGPVKVEGRLSAPLPRLFSLVSGSPLQSRLAPLLEAGTLEGQGALDLQLDIPLRKGIPFEVEGVLQVQDARWALKALPAPVEALNGTVQFSRSQVQASDLRARWLDTDLVAEIVPAETHPGDLRVRASVAADSEVAAAYLPAAVRDRMEGASEWTLQQPLGVADAVLNLESRLQGTALRLPAPFGKPAAEAMPVAVQLRREGGARTLMVDLAGTLASAQIRLPASEGGTWAAEVAFGEAAPPPPIGVDGLRVVGVLPQADLLQWHRLLPEGGGDVGVLRALALRVARLRIGGVSLDDQQLSLQPEPGGYHLALEGSAVGDIRWDTALTAVRADLASLSMGFEGVRIEGGDMSTDSPPGANLQPDTWPALTVRAGKLSLNGLALGEAQLLTERLADGMQLTRFDLAGGQLEGHVEGEWRRNARRGSATLTFDLSSPAVEPTLQAFGFAPSLRAERTVIEGSLHWPDTPLALDWTQGEGEVHLRVRDGTLRTIEPGAGRVLGLMSFYALPRRLTLDFRDVVDDGLRFDSIAADFELADGLARSDNLEIRAPSLRMEIDGSIDLAHRTLDQRVKVLPGLSGGMTLGAALLGGPAIGAIVLLAQELLEKPLDQVTQFGYRVQGSWDNPEVTPLDARGLAPQENQTP